MISVETTARLTICCTAKIPLGRRYARAWRALGKRRTHGLEESHLIADVARLVARPRECEPLRELEHRVVESAMRSLLTFLGRLPVRVALLHLEDPLDGAGKRDEPFLRRACESGAVVEPVEHVPHAPRTSRSITAMASAVSIPACLRSSREYWPKRRFQVLGDSDVVDDEAGRLVAEHPVDAGDRLHEPMPPHGLVDVHRVHARGVEAGQPHVADDHQLERVLGVLGPLREQLPARLAADVLLPVTSGPRRRLSSRS